MLFYQGPDAVVTAHVFQVWYPRYGEFRIADIGQVYVVRNARDAITIRSTVLTGTVLLLTGVCAPILPPSALVVAVVALIASSALTAYRWLHYPPTFELWSDYQGLYVRLYRSHDRQVFGQVSRGLQRAVEAYRNGQLRQRRA